MTAPLVFMMVEWNDPTGSAAAWSDREEAEECVPDRCKTAGWLVARKEHHIVIASTIGADRETFSDLTAIPHGCVVKSWAIEEPRRERHDQEDRSPEGG